MINQLFTKDRKAQTKYIALPNAKEPRVILPIANKKVFKQGFEIHNTASPLNRLLKNTATDLFFLLPYFNSKIVYPAQKLYALLEHLKQNLNRNDLYELSLYIGTKNSVNQKLTMQLMDSNYNILYYVKVASTQSAKMYLQKEIDRCNLLSKISIENITVPNIINSFEYDGSLVCIQNNIFEGYHQTGYDLDETLILAYYQFISSNLVQGNSKCYLEKISKQIDSYDLDDKVRQSLVRALVNISRIEFPLSVQHGDFVPYNIKIEKRKYAIIDWEYSFVNGQPFYDLFHFIYQGKHQILKKNARALVKELTENSKNRSLICKYCGMVGIEHNYINDFFVLYLLEAMDFESKIRSDFRIEESHFYNGLVYLQSIK